MTNGHLVIRPEFVRFLSSPSEADNSLEGRLYNEYALGSRIQYQVRVGEQVFIVEKLRQQAYSGRLDDIVRIGWNAGEFDPCERLMAVGPPRFGPGARAAIPFIALFAIGFVAPLFAVVAFSFMPARTFSIWQRPTLQNYVTIFESTSYISFLWSLGLATLTVILLAVICYPVAYGLNRVFGRWSMALTLLFVIPLFVSENVRLYGWVLFLIKNGVLLGSMKTFFGYEPESILFTRTAIMLGMVYVYLPFMLFPMSLGVAMVPNEVARGRIRSRCYPLAGVPRG